MKTKITIADIAKEANVAKSTVSRYLNGGSISKKTQAKLNRIITAYDYRPNAFAQGLKAKKNRIVGVIVPRLDSSAQVEMLRGLDEANTEHTFLIINTYQNVTNELDAIKRLIEQNVQGLIILTPNMTDEIKQTLLDSQLPVVIQGQDEPDFHRVVMNDLDAGQQVGSYAKSLKPLNTLLLTVSESEDTAVGRDRIQNLRTTLVDSHLEIVETTFNMFDAQQAALSAMQQTPFDLVIGVTDRITVGALQAGISLNKTAKYIGFGKSDFSTTVTPHLTSFEFDFFQTGKVIHELFTRISDSDNNFINTTERIMMSGTLVERASTK